MGLQRYKQKRNFSRTPEPAGKVEKRKAVQMFVIQKHDATRLHYDFRLEMDGVLKSWAVPKGIPTTRGDKRLAAHVEDHPLDYGDFEGIIPEGNYGAGTVMVWDTGTWEPREDDPVKALNDGKIKFTLHGKKLEGDWTLVRMRARSEQRGKDEWLLIKSGEDIKPISAKKDDESVLTHRTMKQIARSKREPGNPLAKRAVRRIHSSSGSRRRHGARLSRAAAVWKCANHGKLKDAQSPFAVRLKTAALQSRNTRHSTTARRKTRTSSSR
jgi:bifunctional non-homologous end joining protein LigD